MTALALEHPAGSAGTTVQAFLARRGVLVAAAIAWALVAVGVGLLIATSDHLVDPIAFGLQRALIVVGWSSAALYWLVRRPGNRLGLALLALAVSTALIGLQGASNPLLYSMGVLDDFPAFLLAYYVVFAFPEGRLAALARAPGARGVRVVVLDIVLPSILLLAGRDRWLAALPLQRRVPHERRS